MKEPICYRCGGPLDTPPRPKAKCRTCERETAIAYMARRRLAIRDYGIERRAKVRLATEARQRRACSLMPVPI